jgi:hypothetical protein
MMRGEDHRAGLHHWRAWLLGLAVGLLGLPAAFRGVGGAVTNAAVLGATLNARTLSNTADAADLLYASSSSATSTTCRFRGASRSTRPARRTTMTSQWARSSTRGSQTRTARSRLPCPRDRARAGGVLTGGLPKRLAGTAVICAGAAD